MFFLFHGYNFKTKFVVSGFQVSRGVVGLNGHLRQYDTLQVKLN